MINSQRVFDILLSLFIIVIFIPIIILIWIFLKLENKESVIFKQTRVGRHGNLFTIFKFRTMYSDRSVKIKELTVGSKDPRITKFGYFLRKLKFDEIPQFINVLKGDISIVGPRPELPKYVALYTQKEKQILNVKPGITDIASIKYFDEDEILGKSKNPEKEYINRIMREKTNLNFYYIQNYNLKTYFRIIFLTILKLISRY